MKLLAAILLLGAACAAPMQQSLSVHDDGSYQFFYETGKEGGQHSRTEVRHPDGVVIGKYSYEDANGALREVSYRADDQGFVEGAPEAELSVPVEEEVPAPAPEASEEEPEPQESAAVESTVDEEPPKNQQQDEPKEELSLDDQPSSANDPPEAFPPGYFLQNFHGLRRLPEPIAKEVKPTTAEEPAAEEPKAEEEEVKDNETGAEEEPPKEGEEGKGQPLNEMDAFSHLRPFRSFAPQPLATSMFRSPVYVFSYQHPDSYGYHYFF